MVHLKELLDRRGITQREAAQAVGTSEGLVHRHIKGTVTMTFETARRYAEYLGVRVCDIDDRFSDAA